MHKIICLEIVFASQIHKIMKKVLALTTKIVFTSLKVNKKVQNNQFLTVFVDIISNKYVFMELKCSE